MQEHSIESLHVYQSAMRVGEECWKLVSKWDSFERQTLGNQLVRAVDSIAANIAEGYGRFLSQKINHSVARLVVHCMKREQGLKRRIQGSYSQAKFFRCLSKKLILAVVCSMPTSAPSVKNPPMTNDQLTNYQ